MIRDQICGPTYTLNNLSDTIITHSMDSRRHTIFPRRDDALGEIANTIYSAKSVAPTRAAKRKFNSGDGIVDLELPRALAPASSMHRVFVPIDEDPERFYQCIYLVDPEGIRPYCLAQEKTLTTNEHPYRIVMIRRSTIREVVGIHKLNLNLLNIISVFRFNESLFTVFDRPGLPLSEIAVCHSPQLGLAQIQTISKEVWL
jgi:hypothetical protein